MMKKNGFISISVIYSFFIIFMLLLFLVMSSYINTRLRLNIYKKDIKTFYAKQETYLYDKIVGDTSSIFIEKTDDNTKIIAYHYKGSNPNNYVIFNDEVWRIVGAVCKNNNCNANDNERSNYLIKIVRNTVFESAWDCKINGVGSSSSDKGSNDWSDSQLMMLLNPSEYYNTGINVSNTLYSKYMLDNNNVYYVQDDKKISLYTHMGGYFKENLPLLKIVQTGKDGFDSNERITECVGSTKTNCLKRISSSAQGKLSDITLYISKTYNLENINNTRLLNKIERANNNKWTGKVSLLYASDFCFASKDNRANCLKNAANSMPTDSWLVNSNNEWVLNATKNGKVVYTATKFKETDDLCSEKLVRPVVYLKSSVTLLSNNTGSSTDPFVIGE